MASYNSREGDMVDAVCAEHYKGVPLDQSVTVVLQANKGLAAYGALLPADVVIELPEIVAINVKATIQLWD
jgi:phage tail protein X